MKRRKALNLILDIAYGLIYVLMAVIEALLACFLVDIAYDAPN